MVAAASIALGLGVICLVLYAFRLNWVLNHTPKEVAALAGKQLTAADIRSAFERVTGEGNGIDWDARLPPRRDRRYVVVGGSGFLGGQIVLDLLARGTPPEAIRILDIRRPFRDEFAHGAPAKVAFVQADITSEASTLEAYGAAWPEAVARLPLTVFHTAAVIRYYERADILYSRSSRVNVAGVANSLAAARRAGATVFIATSSSHAALRRVRWLFAPWGRRQQPAGFVQHLSERDFFEPMPPDGAAAFPSTYARSKAEAERLVCAADEKDAQAAAAGGGMRTGTIRPGNAVYGHKDDNVLGTMLQTRTIVTWVAPVVQNWVYVRNASLAHLQYEAALLGEHAAKVSGRPFLVTDGGPPPRFIDVYNTLVTASTTGCRIVYLPPVLVLMVTSAVEAYCVLLARVPLLRRLMSEPGEPLLLFQPGLCASGMNYILDNSDARRAPEDGGIGYRPGCTSLEGMCQMVADWNEWIKREEEEEEKEKKKRNEKEA